MFKDIIDYNPETGIFIWKKKISNKNVVGKRAGYLSSNGYRYLTIYKKMYLESRVAWYMIHGKFPDNEIDHINRIKDDNRIINLREATRSQQILNSKRKRIKHFELENYPGVIKTENGLFLAHTKKQRKYIRIAICNTPEEAYEKYKEFHKQYNNDKFIRGIK